MKQGWEAGHEAWGTLERSAGRHMAKGATQPVRPSPVCPGEALSFKLGPVHPTAGCSAGRPEHPGPDAVSHWLRPGNPLFFSLEQS